jgi:2-polyprenyl-6-methoxyphenol hydroxylase-like FAD-dependent oxidoreductase
VKVQWNHRLADLRLEEDAVVVAIEELALAGKGYVVPDFEMEVKRTMSARADFVVGTDGQHSAVRQRLGIPCEDAGQPEQFLVCELETEKPVPAEMSIVLHEQTVNVLWPLAENRCRWTFQLSKAGPPADFPQKDRNRFTVAELAGKQGNRPQLEQLLAARAPWFRAGIKNAAWSAQLQFAQRVARPFGRRRAWLAGDAAHQTSPIGMQSMNMGMREGAGLAAKLKQILRDAGSPELLASYNLEQGKEWERLLGLSGAPKPGAGCGEWVRKQSARLLSCLPATGVELGLFLRQLGLEFDAGGAAAAATPG